VVIAAAIVASGWHVAPMRAQNANPPPPGGPGTIDETVPPGENYDKAEFRLWVPKSAATLDATLVLVPGSNGDGRPMADEAFWQEFATKHKLAIVACRFTDKAHDQSFIEEYERLEGQRPGAAHGARRVCEARESPGDRRRAAAVLGHVGRRRA
jgi:poly(3-hydroxybutyrate) depolymerase